MKVRSGRQKKKIRTRHARNLNNQIPVIDVFAGAGGLGEGFAEYRCDELRPFGVKLSVERDQFACSTLKLRTFYRSFPEDKVPDEYYQVLRGELAIEELYAAYPAEHAIAEEEVVCGELGGPSLQDSDLDEFIRNALAGARRWVLVGGPPCQAYSVAGRVRNRGKVGYVPEKDERHFLYQEYLGIIARHWPSVFVMENVKGILTAKVGGRAIFPRILEDLADPLTAYGDEALTRTGVSYRYRIHSLVAPSDLDLYGVPTNPSHHFVIESERYGIPQTRHRVILLGIRDDIATTPAVLERSKRKVSAKKVLEGLPKLRGRLSRESDGDALWRQALATILDSDWFEQVRDKGGDGVADCIRETINCLRQKRFNQANNAGFVKHVAKVAVEKDWYLDGRIGGAANSDPRSHMRSDLHRYLYAACFARIHVRSPRISDFPEALYPKHLNISKALESGHFQDRFRVQLEGEPSSTVVSHISKDGHYYIHYDPNQVRSLTVREAARLQTFKDNYFFLGPRTEQYRQVGNAVPPLLAKQIARVVCDLLQKEASRSSNG